MKQNPSPAKKQRTGFNIFGGEKNVICNEKQYKCGVKRKDGFLEMGNPDKAIFSFVAFCAKQ